MKRKKETKSLRGGWFQPNFISQFTFFLILTPILFFNLLWIFGLSEIISQSLTWVMLRILVFGMVVFFVKKILVRRFQRDYMHLFLLIIISLALSLFNSVISRKFPEANGDSVSSHLLITKAISLGWNPVGNFNENSKLINENSFLQMTDLGPKRFESGIGFQTIQAFYNSFLGIESSYILVNSLFLILVIALILENYSSLIAVSRNQSGTNTSGKILSVILFLATPLVIQQWFSAYTDLAGFCLLSSALILILRHSFFPMNTNNSLWMLVFVLSIMPAIKLQLVILSIPIAAILLVSSISELFKIKPKQTETIQVRSIGRTTKKSFLLIAQGLLLAFPIGYFARNLWMGVLPQLTDEEWVKAAWGGSSSGFMELKGVDSLWTIISGRTALNPESISTDGLFALPSRLEILNSGYVDSRIAGFGPLWGDLLFLSTCTMAIVVIFLLCNLEGIKRKVEPSNFQKIRIMKILLSVFCAYVLMSFIMPFSFTVRYNPHYYLLIFIFLMLIQNLIWVYQKSNMFSMRLKSIRFIVISIFILNSVLVIDGKIHSSRESNELVTALVLAKSNLEMRNESSEFKFYFGNKSGLIKAIVGELSDLSFNENAVVFCPENNRVIQVTDELGICQVS